jgi:DNA processing protein
MEVKTFTPEELLGPLNDVERKNAPGRLYLVGNVELLRRWARVSIVGSRKASVEGLRRTRALSKALVERGVTVVSGLAEGVDTAAHETALAAGGHTLAVVGTPVDRAYPTKNRALRDRFMQELVVSQFPQGYRVQAKSFPMPNRTMALLTDATVIVEAGEKSGKGRRPQDRDRHRLHPAAPLAADDRATELPSERPARRHDRCEHRRVLPPIGE